MQRRIDIAANRHVKRRFRSRSVHIAVPTAAVCLGLLVGIALSAEPNQPVRGHLQTAKGEESQARIGEACSVLQNNSAVVAAPVDVAMEAPFDRSTPESKTEEATMLAYDPEDWPRLFAQHLNAGDLEAVLALYESSASFVPRSGEAMVGREGIRQVMGQLINTKTRLQGRVVKAIRTGEVAVLYTDWQGTTVDSSGTTVASDSRAIEVLRRQPDGTWKLIIGDPHARG